MPKWLDNAVFYEIYPQTFLDTNADGIGDFQGIINKLDYIRDLGFDALWLNPCFLSPFGDAGYDVADRLDIEGTSQLCAGRPSHADRLQRSPAGPVPENRR